MKTELQAEKQGTKAKQEKIIQLQRENKQLKEKVTKKMFAFEKKLKDRLKKFQTNTKDKDVLPKPENLRLKNKRLHEQSNAEKSKCDALGEEVRRLKEISGRKCFVQLLPHCRHRHQKPTFFSHFTTLKEKVVYKHIYLFPRYLDLIKEREGGGNGCDLSDQ